MPVSKKPRKRHQAKPRQIPSLIRYGTEQETDLQLIPHIALEAFRFGHAQESDWHTLAVRVNWGSVLAGRHHPQLLDIAEAGVRAMQSSYARAKRLARWGFSGEELRAVGDALNAADEMQKACTTKELSEALRIVMRAGTDADVGDVAEIAA